MATEESFSPSFSSGMISKSLVRTIANPGFASIEMGLAPEIILLSCRCLSNLIECNPESIIHIVQNNCVEALVSKLSEIDYIDLAEQFLLVLEKISIEYPNSILKSNALLASLQYVDFFSIHLQRTAAMIVANTCHSLPRLLNNPNKVQIDDAFGKIYEIFHILVGFL